MRVEAFKRDETPHARFRREAWRRHRTLNTRKRYAMRWLLIGIAALILLPIVWSLFKFATSLALGLVHVALILAVLIFVVGLIRRMLVSR
jgi:hypothetical protein